MKTNGNDKSYQIKRKTFKPADLIVAAFVILMAVLCILFYFGTADNNSVTAVICVDSQEVKRIDISTVTSPYTVKISGRLDVELLVEKNAISFKDSHCPDKLCVHTGKISAVNQSAVCLPARVSVTLVPNNNNNNSIDAVVG